MQIRPRRRQTNDHTWGTFAMPYSPRFSLSLTPDHYTEIGRIAAYWSRVEHCTQAMIWRILGIRADIARHSTASLRLDTHLDLVTVLCKGGLAASEELRDRALELVKGIKELRGERNVVVHGPWRLGTETPALIKLKSKGLEPDLVPYPIEKTRSVSEKVAALADALTDFLIDYDFHGR